MKSMIPQRTDSGASNDYWLSVINAALILCVALTVIVLWVLAEATVSRLYPLAAVIISLLLMAILLHMRQQLSLEYQKSLDVLLSQKEHTEFTLHSIVDAVITTDVKGHVDYMNQSAEQLTGWSLEKAQGKPIQVIFHITEQDSAVFMNPIAESLNEGHVVRLCAPVRLTRHNLRETMVEVTASPMRNRQGEIISAVLVFHDVSKERKMQDRLDYQATHDSLTGLINRREFERLLAEALKAAVDEKRQHAFCYMDIDHFKVINDTCGYAAGDELLMQLSALLLTTVRGDDLLARLGGDEFALLLYDCPLDEAVNKAQALRNVVEDFRFVWEGRTFDVGFGVGLVAMGKGSGDAADVLRAADSACYAAKTRGRNKIFVYRADDPELQKLRGEIRWATHIGDALRNQQFQLYYQLIQPVQRPETDVFHCELLMRTEDESHKLVSPEAFIPAAERYKLVTDIDRWVINSALPKIAELDAQAPAGKTNLCGINLSGQALSDETFLDYVKSLMERYKVKPASVCFEITETGAIGDLDLAIHFMQEMKALGCVFALDDFGTGVSSYTFLKKFPLDYVKIDGSFIRSMLDSSVDLAMVESVIHIAKVMGIKTVAEYVEDEKTLHKLKELGVDYAQGYGIARPAPLDAVMKESHSTGF